MLLNYMANKRGQVLSFVAGGMAEQHERVIVQAYWNSVYTFAYFHERAHQWSLVDSGSLQKKPRAGHVGQRGTVGRIAVTETATGAGGME